MQILRNMVFGFVLGAMGNGELRHQGCYISLRRRAFFEQPSQYFRDHVATYV